MGTGQNILDGLRDAVAGNMTRVSFMADGRQETWTRHDADSPEAHLSIARDTICDLQTELDARDAFIGVLEAHVLDLVGHLKAHDELTDDEQTAIDLAVAAVK